MTTRMDTVPPEGSERDGCTKLMLCFGSIAVAGLDGCGYWRGATDGYKTCVKILI